MQQPEDKFLKAKELYCYFGGSKFHMSREDVLKEYESYGITKEQEEIWLAELLEDEFNKLNIKDYDSFFPFWNIIESHCRFDYFQKLLVFVERNVEEPKDQYTLFQLGHLIFSLMRSFSTDCQNFSREIKIKGIDLAEILNEKAEDAPLPDNIEIPHFEIFAPGLTKQQYFMRRISGLRQDIKTARILL